MAVVVSRASQQSQLLRRHLAVVAPQAVGGTHQVVAPKAVGVARGGQGDAWRGQAPGAQSA
jgi:hypothetical protein